MTGLSIILAVRIAFNGNEAYPEQPIDCSFYNYSYRLDLETGWMEYPHFRNHARWRTCRTTDTDVLDH